MPDGASVVGAAVASGDALGSAVVCASSVAEGSCVASAGADASCEASGDSVASSVAAGVCVTTGSSVSAGDVVVSSGVGVITSSSRTMSSTDLPSRISTPFSPA